MKIQKAQTTELQESRSDKLSQVLERNEKATRLGLTAAVVAINQNFSSKDWKDEAIARLVNGIIERWGDDRFELVVKALKDLEQGRLQRTQLGSMLPGEVYTILQNEISGKVYKHSR